MPSEIIFIGFIGFFVIQLFILFRIVLIIRRFTKMLFEIRLIFKHAGISYDHKNKRVIENQKCLHCKFRAPFIDMTGKGNLNDFYYKCTKHNIEVNLNDTCDFFARDFQLK